MRYRRMRFDGAAYFFTVNLADRSSCLLVERIGDLRVVVGEVRRAHPFEIVAWVVLPDHLHALWRMPEGDTDYPTRWALIKAGFSRTIPKVEQIVHSRKKKGERGIWQRRYWEHTIRDDTDLGRHMSYIHYNPVKHGYVRRAMDWEFSTFHRYVRIGWIPEDWGHGEDFGEA
ncbi:MAG: putative transposase [Candidatus Kentron sp. G]|nr:MAG: putative transposase [Candidatus Kentron sp. G]VFM95672.1 MAG: putative transposase [Candidatus Kentron sp. G]VFN03321.1 MAG: putative transposase [Candidatus Kentron sp. G]